MLGNSVHTLWLKQAEKNTLKWCKYIAKKCLQHYTLNCDPPLLDASQGGEEYFAII